MKRAFKKLPFPFKYLLLFAVVLIVIFVTKDYIKFLMWRKYDYFDWAQAIAIPFVNYVLWAFLAPLVYNLMLLFPLKKGLSATTGFYHLFFSFIMAFFHEVISNMMYITIILAVYPIDNVESFLVLRMNTIPAAIADRMIEYWIILGAFMAYYYFKQYKDRELEIVTMENELSNAQLKALRNQLQPHFLFNSLNTVSALMSSNVKDAQRVLAKLATLLRSMLDQDQKNAIPLQDELEYLKNYLFIEQTRFMDRLVVKYEIQAESLKTIVPNLILQPLVENAVKHGFSHKTEEVTIIIRSYLKNNQLHMFVEDDGIGCDHCDSLLEHAGIGLTNTNERLKQIYKNKFTFKLTSGAGKGFKVHIAIPINYATYQ
jgi:sensor histidine kinase YesM